MNEETDFDALAPWLAVIITLAGAGLRVLLLDHKGMGMDEAFSVWLAGHGVGDMIRWIVKIDQHPPLYYILLHYWMALNGATVYAVRFLSVLFGAGAIPIIYLIGKRMADVKLGLAAAVILAFSPFHIFYAQETRMYTLLAFNAAVALYALVRLLTDPCAARPIGSQVREYWRAWRTSKPFEPPGEGDFSDKGFSYQVEGRDLPRWRAWIARHRWLPIQAIETDLAWVALIVFTALTLYSHNTAVLFPLAANLFVLGLMLFQRTRKSGEQSAFRAPSFSNWIKAQVAILLLWIPWAYPFIQQARGVYQRFWIPAPTWDAVRQMLLSFLNASGPIPAHIATVVWILYALALALGLWFFRKKVAQFLFLAALFAIPLLGELVVSLWRPIFWDRTLIWTTIPVFLVLAAGVAQLKFRLLMIFALGSLATINLFSAGDYYRFYYKEDWNTAARDVAGWAQKGDLVLFNSNLTVLPFNFYFKPYEDYYFIQVEKRGLPLDLFESEVAEPEMTASDIPGLKALLNGHRRVWLVYSHASYTDPQGLIPQTLASQMKLTMTDNFYGGQVQLYESP